MLMTLYGESGAGKNTSAYTILHHPKTELVMLSTEDNAKLALRKFVKNHNPPEDWKERTHFCTIQMAPAFSKMAKTMKTLSTMSQSEAMKHSDPSKKEGASYLNQVLESYADLTTDAGENLGKLQDWPKHRVLVIDNLTNLIEYIFLSRLGFVPIVGMDDYGYVQKLLLIILDQLRSVNCLVVMLAHESESKDGKTLPLLPGQAINAAYPGKNTDIIRAYKDKQKFYWNTEGSGRILANSKTLDKLSVRAEPSFVPYMENFLDEEFFAGL